MDDGGLTKGTKPAEMVDDQKVIAAEIAKTTDGQTINVNILLASVTRNADSSGEAIENAERALEIAKKYEDHSLQAFIKRSEALISYKARDPDEVEKRHNNRTRRCLKFVVAGCGILGLGGMLACAAAGVNIVVTALAGIIGAVCLASLAPLASGESVSSGDVVQVVRALTGAMRPQADTGNDNDDPSRKRRHKR